MDVERFQQAVLTVITSVACTIQDPDDLLELSDFLAREVQDSGVILPDVVEDAATNNVSSQRSLEELESMPTTNIIGPHLVDMLDIPSTHVPIVIDEILDAYIAGETSEPSQIVESQGFDKERLCELCDRPAFLTDHHLIPRSEHDLFVKRGVFTLQECRTRLAKLCRPCHSAVHRVKSTRELANEYNTVEKLLEIPEVARFAEWNAKRKVVATIVQRRKRR